MEIMYEIKSKESLQPVNCTNVRWLKIPEDFSLFQKHLSKRGSSLTINEWKHWQSKGIDYCGLIVNGEIVARAYVERYSENKWETADVWVLPMERGKGYGKQVVSFITKYILENSKIATCRTRVDNIAMQRLALSIGFKKVNYL